jgi:hypothetical protein
MIWCLFVKIRTKLFLILFYYAFSATKIEILPEDGIDPVVRRVAAVGGTDLSCETIRIHGERCTPGPDPILRAVSRSQSESG